MTNHTDVVTARAEWLRETTGMAWERACLQAERERDQLLAIETEYGQTVVAVAFDADDSVYDHCFTWETAQSMAPSDGYRIVAVAGDGHMSREEIQALCDAERERFADCFARPLSGLRLIPGSLRHA